MPRGSRQPPATLTPGWAPGRSAVERGRSLRPSTTRPGPRPTLPRPPPHDLRRVAPPGRLGPSTEPLGTPQTTGNSIRPRRDGCPPHRCDPQGHRRASADETEVTGQTGGHQPAGRRTGGHQPAGQPDPGRPNQMTGHRPAGHRTAGQPDPGHRNECGHPMVDTDRRRTAWQTLAFPTAATPPYRWGAVGKLGRSDAAWSISNQDSSAERTLRRGQPPP
jgi:hypothetical protein